MTKIRGTAKEGGRRRPRLLLWATMLVLLAATATAGGVLARPTPAQAAVNVVACTGGAYSINLSPGLTTTTHAFTVSGSGSLLGCLSVAPIGDPTVDGNATFTVTGSGSGSCTNGFNITLTPVITWANGNHSNATGSASLTVVAGIPVAVTATGSVASGEFAGTTALALPVFGAANLADCLTPTGVTLTVGAVTLFTLV